MILFLHIYILCSYVCFFLVRLSFFLVSCLRFLSLMLCWFAVIMVVRDWFAWSVAAMVGSACAAFVRSFVCFVYLFIYILCKYTRKRTCLHIYGNTMAWATALANTACNLYKVNNLHVETTQSLQRQH